PPIRWPCYYGIDTPTRKELIGASHRVEEICRYLGADSVGYLSLEGMLKASAGDGAPFCHACFSGEYEVGFPREDTSQLALFEGWEGGPPVGAGRLRERRSDGSGPGARRTSGPGSTSRPATRRSAGSPPSPGGPTGPRSWATSAPSPASS